MLLCYCTLILFIVSSLSHQALASCDPSCLICPCFPRLPRPLSLPDTIQPGTPIATLTASFASNAPPLYTLTGTTDFTIDSGSGVVTTARTLDYATRHTYSLTIQATDSSYMTSTVLTVTLIDTSSIGTSLVCTADTVRGEIVEGDNSTSQIPLPVCFNGDGSVALVSELVYTISSGNTDSLFVVSSTGSVSNTGPLDYETDVLHTLVLSVMNSELPPRTSILTVVVTVTPVNEFTPVFTSDPIQVSVSEALNVGRVIGRVEALDQDAGEDGRVTYSLLSSSDVVFIHPTSGTVILTGTLDFESDHIHNVTVVAMDTTREETSRRSATALLTIVVQDANDSPPSFPRSLYSVSVQEDANIGHTLSTFSCSDQDTGINSQVAYSITSGNADGLFELDGTSGLFTLTGTLDFDVGARLYSLTVQCRETQPPSLSAETLVLVQVTSFNEFNPDPGGTYQANIREDTAPGTQVLQVEGTDRDSGLAGTLEYFINNNNNHNNNNNNFPPPMASVMCPDNLYMDPNSGEMYLMAAFDHESGRTSYHCTLLVRDLERPIHFVEQDIFITIVDVNDAPPLCTPSVSRLEVPEDTNVGDPLLTLSCRDPDSATLQYEFTDSSITGFRLSPTGVVSLGERLDYETQSLYILSISVSDGEFSTNTTIYLTVSGVNEDTPFFPAPPTNCSIPENAIHGSPVCTLSAMDADSGDDGVISFDFAIPTSFFEVDSSTGEIYVVGDLDYETAAQHSLTVRVTDGGSPALTNQIPLDVVVSDENDNSPELSAHIVASVAENAGIGTLVTTLVCRDADQPNAPNSDTTLAITNLMQELPDGSTSPVTTPLFDLASTTGELTTSDELDYESVSLYHVSVTCRDHGTPLLATPTTVLIQVAPVNEITPMFTQAQYEVTISESVALGTPVVTVMATDGDRDEQGDVSYSIASPTSSPFWVDPHSGALYVTEPLQCHMETRHTLTVRPRDGGTPLLESDVNVIINVDPCQFGKLVPSSSMYLAEVDENAAMGTPVLGVLCTSSRRLPTLTPSYMMTQPSSVFEVDENSGSVSVLSSPDYERVTCTCDASIPTILTPMLMSLHIYP